MLDVAFVLDFSGSVNDVYDVTIQFTKNVIRSLPMQFGRTRVGLVSFSDNARLQFGLNRYSRRQEVQNAVVFDGAGARGRTNTQEALQLVLSRVFTQTGGDRPGIPNIVILVTDGNSNINPGERIK